MENNQMDSQNQSSTPISDNNMPVINTGNKNKKLIIIIIVLAAIVLLFLVWPKVPPDGLSGKTSNSKSSVLPSPTSTQLNIEQELNGTNLGNIDEEFKSIDKDLNSL